VPGEPPCRENLPLQVHHGVHAPETESVAVSYQGCFVKARLPGRSSPGTPGAGPAVSIPGSEDPLGIEPWRFLHEHPVQTLRPVRPVCEPVLEPTLGPRSCLRVQRRSPRQFCDSSEGRRNGTWGTCRSRRGTQLSVWPTCVTTPTAWTDLTLPTLSISPFLWRRVLHLVRPPCRWRPPSRS
jgi:hypothetical protein